MIAIDTSALVAILFGETEADRFADLVRSQRTVLIGVPTALEFHLVVQGRSYGRAASEARELLASPGLVVVPFDERHLARAMLAFDRYGKGRHPARLNFGDCMAYAVAAVADVPLLYKGDDFARTDIRAAL